MWKYFPGSIKECLKTVCSPVVQPRQPKGDNIFCFKKLLYNSQNDDRQTDSKKANAKNHRHKTWETNAQIQHHNWIGALRWSGILVLGWYLCHPSHFQTLFDRKIRQHELKYASPVQILIKSVHAQPIKQILPLAITSVGESNKNASNQFVTDALDKAAENLAQAQGSVENRLGVELARRQRHEDAAALFLRAADRGHPTAAFNLGLCYELGLGTKQDFKKAAECYETASIGGHAGATYNLGVFYVHGWGGKQPDRTRARQLFVTAASMGQKDAQIALGMTKAPTESHVDSKLQKIQHKNISQLVQDTIHKYTSIMEV